MNLEYTFIAIMFPAIPLTMVMFGTRFHTTSVLIRQMHDEYIYEKVMPAEFNKQLEILKSRIILLKRAQISMGLSFLFNMLSVFALFFNKTMPAKFFFAFAGNRKESFISRDSGSWKSCLRFKRFGHSCW